MPFHPDRPSRPRRPCSQVEPAQPSHTPGAPIDGPLLYTPGEAAQLLKVRESWLRKKAAARQVPCTFLGKHLRFSPTDLAAIVAGAAQPPTGHRRSRPTTTRDRDLIRPPDRSVDPPRPDDHNHREGSTTWRG
jgi:excisionase family DNA binding protein